jgi:hypothetical protein
VPLSAIRANEQAQPRAALDEDRVAEYVETMGRGEKFPPLVLFQDKKGRYWLADGFHRFHAAIELKRKTIECIVHQGELRAAILFSCSANASHGMPRTSADKRTVVTRLLTDPEWGKWSNVEIAKRCRVSDEFVRKLRQQREPVTSNIGSENERTYTDKHGNTATMRTGNIGSGSKPAASGAERTSPAVNDGSDDVAQPDKPAPESTEFAAAPVVDHPAPSKDDARSAPDLAPAKTDAAPPTAPGEPGPPPDLYGLHCAAVLDTIRGTIRGLTNVDFNQVATIPTDELLEVRSELDEAAGALRAVITRAIESAGFGQETSPPAGHGVREC